MYPLGLRCLPLAVSAILFLNLPGHAADRYWDTLDNSSGLDAGNGIWDTGTTALWNSDSTGATSPLVTWANGDDAFFQTGGTNVVTLSGTIQANSLSTSVNGTNTTLNGGTLELNSATVGLSTTNSPILTINSAVTIGASQQWTTSAGSLVTVNGDVSGAGTTLTLTGGGTGGNRNIHLNGTNSIGGLEVEGTGSTARTLYLSGPSTLTGTLDVDGTTTVNAQFFSGSDNSFQGAGNSIFLAEGTLALGGTNTVANTIRIQGGGNLIIERDANIGGGSGTLSFDAASLRILGTSMTSFGSHALTFSNGSNLRLDIADPGNVFTVGNVIGGGATGGLTKIGKGTVVLTGASVYGSGGTAGGNIVRGGTLHVDNNNGGSVSNTARLLLSGGTFLLTGKNGDTTTQGTGAVLVDAVSGITFGSTIKVNGGTSTATTLNLGTITATVNGGTLNFVTTGTTTPTITTATDKDATGIYGGRITFNGTNWATTASGGSPFILSAYTDYNGGGAFSTNGVNTFNSLVTGTSALTGNLTTNTLKIDTTGAGQSLTVGGGNTLELTAGGMLFAGADDYTISDGTVRSFTATNSDLIVHQHGTGTLTISSAIADGNGTSVLTKTGAGTLTLSGANTYTGATNINEGILSASVVSGANNNLGAGAQILNINGGTLQYTGATATKGGAINLGSMGGTFDITNAGTTLTLSGAIGDTTQQSEARPGSLTKKGAGTLSISGGGNNAASYIGGVFIEAGVLQAASASAFNTTNPNTVTFMAGSTGTLRINGNSVAISGLNSDSVTPGTTFVENNHATNASTLTVNTTFASRYAGTIRDGAAASLALNKVGGNTLTLSGANTYTGGTTVTAGTLLVNNTTDSGTGTGTVNVGLAGTLGGTGTIGGATTIAGTLAPGVSAESLGFSSSLTLQSTAITNMEIDGLTRGMLGGYDAVNVGTELAYGGTLNAIFSIPFGNNTTFNLFDFVSQSGNLSAINLSGSYNGTLEHQGGGMWTGSAGGQEFEFSTADGVLQIIPEPSTFAMLLGGLGLLLGFQRSRRRTA